MNDATEPLLSQEMIDEFVVAAHHDLNKVESMLHRNPRLLNESASWLETPLGAAAHTGNRAIAQFLLSSGAPLDICSAAMLGLRDDVANLIEADPNLLHATGAHNIPLMYHAAISGDVDLVRWLVDQGADVNAGIGLNTALHAAAGFNHPLIVRYLLDMGADFMAHDHDGRTPLDVAEQTNHRQVETMLRAHMDQA